MKMKTSILTLCLIAARAFAQTDDDKFLAEYDKTFEPGGAVNAKQFVSDALISGSLHGVGARAYNDGLRNTYFVQTHDREIEVTGTPALEARIREIYALDYLRGLSKTAEFGKAITQAGKAKIESAVGIISDPVGTIKSVPRGASRFFGRIGEGLKGGASRTEDGGLKGLTGVSAAKAKLAAKLGVSPYTTNEELQQELTNTARAMAGGGLIVNAATSAASGGVGAALTVVGMNQTMQDTLINSTPDDLRILNRKNLLALGTSRAQADEFLMHPWFSPWHETITTDALARIGVNPTSFLDDACRALTTEDAFFFQRLAQILAQYHATTTPLRAIRLDDGIVTALDRDGTLVVPISCDYAIWAERTARRAEEFIALKASHPEIKSFALWTDGALSERLCDELKKRGIAYRMHALDDAAR